MSFGPRPGAFILNSWGDTVHGGPVWPADAPVAGFWADKAVVERMLRTGEAYALSDMVGFPARRIDWFAHTRPAPRKNAFDAPFALAP